MTRHETYRIASEILATVTTALALLEIVSEEVAADALRPDADATRARLDATLHTARAIANTFVNETAPRSALIV